MSTVHEQLEASVALERQKDFVVPQVVPTPMAMIQMAVANGGGKDLIESLVRLQREEREYQAELEFNEAMQKAQARMGRIGVDATNPQTRSKYATYAKLDSAVRPIYTEYGFSLSFDEGDSPIPDTVRVLCYVAHKGGFSRTYKKDMPADGKGAKGGDVMTKTHASGAATSYGMRYLLKMIFNVAVGETDDDGNLGNKPSVMPDEDFAYWKERIEAATDLKDLDEKYNAACDTAARDEAARANFKTAAGKRYAELSKAAKK